MTDAARFWDQAADKYAKKPVRDTASYERTLASTRDQLAPGDEVLEVGCGTGTTALALAASAKHYTATDISSRMIEIAREKAAVQGTANVRFEQGTLEDESLEPGSFDVVLAFNVLHLLEDMPRAVRRVSELLRPGGRFVSKTVCLGEKTRLWGMLLGLMRLVGLAPPVSVLDVAGLEDAIRGAGLEIIESEAYPGSLGSHFIVARKTGSA